MLHNAIVLAIVQCAAIVSLIVLIKAEINAYRSRFQCIPCNGYGNASAHPMDTVSICSNCEGRGY